MYEQANFILKRLNSSNSLSIACKHILDVKGSCFSLPTHHILRSSLDEVGLSQWEAAPQ